MEPLIIATEWKSKEVNESIDKTEITGKRVKALSSQVLLYVKTSILQVGSICLKKFREIINSGGILRECFWNFRFRLFVVKCVHINFEKTVAPRNLCTHRNRRFKKIFHQNQSKKFREMKSFSFGRFCINAFTVWKLREFSLTYFWQKFRESNGFTGFTKEITY